MSKLPTSLTCLVLMICPLHGQVVINEIHPSPDVNQERVEFVELYNGGTNEVALDGWSLGGGIGYPFPAGARIPAGGFAVVAENPAALSAKFGFNGALGPWSGRLSGNGERITLRDSTQGLVDSVTFGRGFPWPTVGEAPGYSMELIHPGLDNDLGGHWRASITGGSAQGAVNEVLPAGGLWKYLPGTAEASSPTQAWRTPAFDDSTWTSGRLPIGYDPAVAIRTPLTGMSGSFQQIYLRTQFRVTNATAVSRLSFEALYDDGFNLWVNGRLLIQASMSGEVVAFNAAATSTRESDAYDRFEVSVPPGLLNEGENTVAVQVANILLSGSSDCFFDVRVSAVTGPAGRGPTPGQRNVVSETNAPPALRQLGITPLRPRSGDPVRVQVKATDPDGVDSVELEYQVVEPGAYVRFDTPQYASQWTRVPMNDRALGGDVLAGDDVYSVTLPASLQVHRRLIRYRILARDRRGAEVRIPYADDAGRNFAWFVYDGVPAWTGAIRPGAPSTLGNVRTVGTEEMNRLPVYHLIARKEDVEAATWRDRSHGDEYFWTGTLVYDGVVYDHIRFRPRGGGWRYAMGKNMWKFDFNRGHEFEPRDNWGRRMRTPWSKLNLGACIQQGDFEFRGEQGLFEGVGFRLFQLAGQPAGDSAHVQFRIVDSESETNPADQYSGDFWGLYLAVEQPDGRFLAEHGLPDGNLYKMEAGFGDPNNLGPEGPVDSSDLRGFLNAYNGPLAGLSESWWRTNLNLESYFNYQAVVQTIHHYDIADGKNYFYYRNPVEGRWQVIPWDLDLTWADNMYRGGQQGGDEPFKSRVLTGFSASAEHYPAISREFRNRVRELRDLLINTNEAWSLIDEQARLLRGTNALSLVDADRAQWDYNPVMTNSSLVILSKAGHGRFYQRGTPTRDFPGMVQWMKNYLRYRTTDPTFSLDTLSVEPWRPAKPVISYIGSPGFAVDRLSFRTTGFQGNGSLASVRWRIAEVTRTNHPAFRADRPQAYEINPVWDSGELTQPAGEQTFPALDLRVGRLYRARVRHMDAVGRTSNWSDPVEFTAGDPVDSGTLLSGLRLTEIMYNPPADGFEYLEIQNRSASVPIQLSGATFTAGISFVFPENAVLSPGSHALVIRSTNIAGFRSFHGLAESIPIFGPYSGALANEGETVTLRTAPGGSVVFSLAYGIASPWPSTPNGEGFSLVPVNPGSTNLNEASAWRSSTVFGGSPGGPDPDIQSIRLGEPRLESFNGRTVLRLRLSGSYPIPVVVESSNDLRTWTPALTNPVPAELRLSTDPDGAFFRVRR